MKTFSQIINNEYTKNVLRIVGAYGIIQVFAQDVGVRTGCRQAMLGQHVAVQFVVFTAVAYSVSDDFFQSVCGTAIYFVLKYYYSRGVTNDVCFPTECDIRKCAHVAHMEAADKERMRALANITHGAKASLGTSSNDAKLPSI